MPSDLCRDFYAGRLLKKCDGFELVALQKAKIWNMMCDIMQPFHLWITFYGQPRIPQPGGSDVALNVLLEEEDCVARVTSSTLHGSDRV
ncbi:hypothetical protein A6X21_11110 [Planctopirus hydrillae]|uniref:Uncharacterized protein n=1 Tax=Planctopirus hydrillae TaxID=1841610 RepID=A0A1C3E6J1_9PLAN|nr:hypothetical protein A6X21_11110 [Planctopirus hydrillae]